MQQKKRLDQLLFERGLVPSRSQAQALILGGQVWVEGKKVEKAGHAFLNDIPLEIRGSKSPFVSRGGQKLDHALQTFDIKPAGWAVLDIGASTGGFTDCLLKAGAQAVTAVDVGYGQLAWSLRQDPRVKVFEKTNIRNFSPNEIEAPVDAITIDVSFISLKKVIPLLPPFLKPQGCVIALVKPQFEVTRQEVGKKGVVKDPTLHQRVIQEIKDCFEKQGFRVCGETLSPLLGPEGNKEFLIWATLTNTA